MSNLNELVAAIGQLHDKGANHVAIIDGDKRIEAVFGPGPLMTENLMNTEDKDSTNPDDAEYQRIATLGI